MASSSTPPRGGEYGRALKAAQARAAVTPESGDEFEEAGAVAEVPHRLPLRPAYKGEPFAFKKSSKPRAQLTDEARQQAVFDFQWLEKQDVETRASFGARFTYDDTDREEDEGQRRSERVAAASSSSASSSGQRRGVLGIVAAHYGIAKPSLHTLLKTVDSRPSVTALERSGRPTTITPTKRRRIAQAFNEAEGLPMRALAAKVQDLPGYESTYRDRKRTGPAVATVWRQFRDKKIEVHTLRDRPPLTEANKKSRLEFCRERLGAAAGSCDLDEARVRQSTGSSRYAVVPGEEELRQGASNTRIDAAHGHPPNVLLLAMIKAPKFTDHVDAETGETTVEFDPVKNGKEDDPIFEDITVSGTTYYNIMAMEGGGLDMLAEYESSTNPNRETAKVLVVKTDGLVEDRRGTSGGSAGARRSSRAAGQVRLQEDGAGGHGFSGWHGGKETDEHAKLVAACKARGVLLEKQPPNSPETNLCDLGLWRLLKAAVERRRAEVPAYTGSNTDEVEAALWRIVKEEWAAIEPRKLFNIAMVKEAVFEFVVEAEGGELGRDPHVKVRRMFGTGSPKRE